MTRTQTFFNTTRRGIVAGAAFVGFLSFAGQAQASAITFSFNCVIVNAITCNAGGSFGTLTLTDSLVDPNRVDVDVILNAANIQAVHSDFTGLNNFFLNYGGPTPANTSFKLVRQSDPFGTFTNTSGDANINPNDQGPLGTRLDLKLNPVGSATSLTYSGSLVLRLDPNPHTETNLDVSMFNLKDANGLLYAGFDTMPNNQRFFGGSTAIADLAATANTPVPEPTSLVLLGSGLLAATRHTRRRMLKR